MDEPLSNLDAKLRVQTRTQIASLQRRLGVTTVYVTHDQIEALTMGDRIARAQGRPAAAGRHPARPVRPPEQRVRRRLHRLPGHEPVSVPVTEGGVQFGSHRLPGRPRAARQGRQPGHRRRPPRGRRGHDQRGRPRGDRRRRRGARRRRLPLRHPGQRTTCKLEGGDDGSPSRSSPASTAASVPTRGRRSSSTPTPSHMHVFDPEQRRSASADPTAAARDAPDLTVRGVAACRGRMPSAPVPS